MWHTKKSQMPDTIIDNLMGCCQSKRCLMILPGHLRILKFRWFIDCPRDSVSRTKIIVNFFMNTFPNLRSSDHIFFFCSSLPEIKPHASFFLIWQIDLAVRSKKKPPSCWFYLSNFFQHLVIVLIEIFHNFSQNSFSWTWQRSPREPVSFFLSSFNLDMLELIWVDYSAYLLIIMLLRKKYKWLFLEIFI